MSLELMTSRLRSMSRMCIFQRFDVRVPHLVPQALADTERIEHSLMVLETIVLPLNYVSILAEKVGLEPTTSRLTADCSTN